MSDLLDDVESKVTRVLDSQDVAGKVGCMWRLMECAAIIAMKLRCRDEEMFASLSATAYIDLQDRLMSQLNTRSVTLGPEDTVRVQKIEVEMLNRMMRES